MPLVARKFLAMSLPLLSKIHSLFEEAEDALKLYERISLSNLAPALNELRYAGHHILAAEAAEDDAVRDSHVRRAVGHCERAKYDAKEATVISLLECIAELRDLGVSAHDMRAFIPDWDVRIEAASAARSKLERAGKVKDACNDGEFDESIATLMDFRDRILAAESQVLALRNRREEEARQIEEANQAEKARAEDEAAIARERKEDRRYVASMILSAVGIVLGVLGLAFTIYGIVLTIRAG